MLAVVTLAVSFAGAVLAGGTGFPPPTEDIVGDYVVSMQGPYYDFGVPKAEKSKGTGTMSISQIDGAEVELTWVMPWDPPGSLYYRGYYLNGLLIIGTGDNTHTCGTDVEVLYLEFSGTPAKMSMKGRDLYYNVWDEMISSLAISGKKVVSSNSIIEYEPAQPTVGARAFNASPPPTIDELHMSHWVLGVSGTEYAIAQWTKESLKGSVMWTITKLDPYTVSIEQTDDEETITFQGYYDGGTLVIGFVSAPEHASTAMCAYGLVTGSPGKMKIKGEFITYEISGSQLLSVGTISGKQVAVQ
jgi:hypothetical protein